MLEDSGNKLNFRCPICGDGKKKQSKRGYFYLEQGTYWCWNGGCPANEKGYSGLQFLSIITHKSIPEIKADLIKRAGSFTSVLKEDKKPQKTMNDLFDDLQTKKTSLNILDTWVTPPDWLQQEIDRRKIYESAFINKDWQLYYDTQTKRLVIPWTKEYYQLRAITKKQEIEEGKYLFPPDSEKPIFGLENIDPNFKYLFLLEGVFDAIFVKNGLAVGSLKLSNKQKEILETSYNDYSIIYFMDNQFKDKSSYFESIKLSKNSPNIKMFIWPESLKNFKDVNDSIIFNSDLCKLWSNEKFLTSRIFNGLKANLELKKI